jgi:hypothetical protein
VVLWELKEIINLLFLAKNRQLPVKEVIEKLEWNNYLAAADISFNFKVIKRSALKKETVKDVPLFKGYIEWPMDRLLENIYLKVKQLQAIAADAVAAAAYSALKL